MAQIIVRLKCITNLHVGNGDVNYSIVDNEVERDPVTNYPVINSSGVKGALREYFKAVAPELVASVFGSDEAKNTTQGKLKFLTAEMLAVAARASRGESAYCLVSTETAVSRFSQMKEEFLGDSVAYERGPANSVEIEGFSPAGKLNTPFGDIYLLSEEDFRHISLPVMARNCLEDGRSTNLWYEEVVPHESLFFFPVLANDQDKDCLKAFAEKISGRVVQFGGNATIGYGLCKVCVMEEKA